MANKTVKILTQLKARSDEEFGCAAVDEQSRIWIVVLKGMPGTTRSKVRVGEYLVLHNVVITFKMIRATEDKSKVGRFPIFIQLLNA
jgi:hypothetical protein